MKFQNFAAVIILLIVSACATNVKNINTTKIPTVKEEVYWVNGKKPVCENCLEIQKGEVRSATKWETLPNKIEGFDFEEGYVYKLLLKEEQSFNVGTNSSKNLRLVKVMDKSYNPKLLLNGKWQLVSIMSDSVKIEPIPWIKFEQELRKVTGFDGCNNFVGEIKSVVDNSIFLGNLASNRKACPNMEVISSFNEKVNAFKTFEIKNDILRLFNDEGKEILGFVASAE